jgi:hypothetical protein
MLTKEQIDFLFKFCHQHYVHFYEVQAELVDHLATLIEQELEKDPSLSFESALDRAYNQLGGYKGMQKVQEEKKKQVRRAHARLRWRIFLAYFRWPKALFTATLALACFTAFSTLPPTVLQVGVPLVALGLLVVEMQKVWQYQHRSYFKNRNLLLLHYSDSWLFYVLTFSFGNQLLVRSVYCFVEPFGSMQFNPYGYTVLITLYYLGINSYREYLQRIHNKARELYPQLFEAA